MNAANGLRRLAVAAALLLAATAPGRADNQTPDVTTPVSDAVLPYSM